MEYHRGELKRVCRVCGRRVNKAKGRERQYLVTEFTRELGEVFRIDVSGDSDDIHPLSVLSPLPHHYQELAHQGRGCTICW